jgi:WD40 repeat protein
MAYKSRTLFTGSFDTKVVKWDAVTGNDLFRYSGRQSIIRCVVSWKKFIISGSEDAEIRMWDASIDSIDPFAILDGVSWSVSALLVFEDLLYFGEVLGDIKAVSLANHTLIRTLTSNFLIRFRLHL